MRANIVTYTGKVFDLLNPKPEMVCIEDIAHSLAYQCRYNGHCKFFYSVAQHCVLMARNRDLPGDPLQKLLHDAAEAYIGDIVSPWKKLLCVSDGENGASVSGFEVKIQAVIGRALGVDLYPTAEVKKSDKIMMATEIRDLMPKMLSDYDWGLFGYRYTKNIISPWGCRFTENKFLQLYKRLTRE